jgi:hypothetical protein
MALGFLGVRISGLTGLGAGFGLTKRTRRSTYDDCSRYPVALVAVLADILVAGLVLALLLLRAPERFLDVHKNTLNTGNLLTENASALRPREE